MPRIDKSKLVPRKIVDKLGRKRTVWVRVKETGKKHIGRAQEAATERKQRKQMDYAHAKTFTDKTRVFMKRQAKSFVKQLKGEVKEWKEAGTGLGKVFTGKGALTKHEKKAITTVALHTAFVVGLAAFGAAEVGGASAVALAKTFAGKAAMGYLEHTGIIRGAKALIFKADTDLSNEEALEVMTGQMIDWIHDNDLTKK